MIRFKKFAAHCFSVQIVVCAVSCASGSHQAATPVARSTTTTSTRAAAADPKGRWPLALAEHKVNSQFGDRANPMGGGEGFHKGADLAAPSGTPVLAFKPGRVAFVGTMSGYGKLVIVDHGGDFSTYYAHLSSMRVRPGQPVGMGESIGAVGSTGRATSPHLHFETRRAGNPVDPVPYLRVVN